MSVAQKLRPGCRVAENIELVRLLGRGGMSSVWLARHLSLNVDVAVKFIAEGHDEDSAAIVRFLREARALARVDSPHVVRVLDAAARPNERPYMVLELLTGETLDAHLARSGPLSIADALTVVRQIGNALDAAHAAGVIHRDVKPENVFVSEVDGAPFVKVLDFGISVYRGDNEEGPPVRITSTGQTFGTPAFMSPEQMLSAKAVDSGCDVWALAVVAYVCLFGKLPFDGETFGAVCVEVHRRRYDSPSGSRQGVPLAVDEFFRRAFHHDPRERFASGTALADGLEAAFSRTYDEIAATKLAEGARAMKTSTTSTKPRAPSPHRGARLGIALAGVAAVAAMAVLTTRSTSDSSNAVGTVPLTGAIVPARSATSTNEQMVDPPLVPPNEARTTSATVFIAEGADPDKPVQAP